MDITTRAIPVAYHSRRTAVLAKVQLDWVLCSTWEVESLKRLSAAKRSVLEVSAGNQPFFQPSSVPVAFADPIARSKQFNIITRIGVILQVTQAVNVNERAAVQQVGDSKPPMCMWLMTCCLKLIWN